MLKKQVQFQLTCLMKVPQRVLGGMVIAQVLRSAHEVTVAPVRATSFDADAPDNSKGWEGESGHSAYLFFPLNRLNQRDRDNLISSEEN